MSVRGEYRRIGADLLATLRADDPARDRPETDALAGLLERAERDLSGAAEDTLALLERVGAASLADTTLRRRFEEAYDRLDAVCRIILGLPAR